MYTISKTTEKNIERATGLPVEKLRGMTALEETEWLKRKGAVLFPKLRRHGIIGRGNPLLARRKIRTMEDLNRKSRKMIGI